jgi:hypothetical protein
MLVASAYSFTIYCILLLLEKDLALSKWHYLIISIFIFSTPLAGAFVLLAGIRLYFERKNPFLAMTAILFLMLSLSAILTLLSDNKLVKASVNSFDQLLFGIYDRFVVYSFLIPFFSKYGAETLTSDIIATLSTFITAALLMIVIAKEIFFYDRKTKTILVGLFLSLLLFYSMHILSKTYSASPSLSGICIYCRHSYIGYIISIISILVITTRLKHYQLKTFIVGWLCIANSLVVYEGWNKKIEACPNAAKKFLADLDSALNLQKNKQIDSTVDIGPLMVAPVAIIGGNTCSEQGAIANVYVKITQDSIQCRK